MQEHQTTLETLVSTLQELRELHEQLLLAARNKQKYMRSGEIDSLESWSAREQFLIERIGETDARRRETAEALAEGLGKDEPVTLRTLAESLAEPDRSRLLALAGAIRSLADQVYQVNRINDAVTREILQCFAQMQRNVAAAQGDIGLYDGRGQRRVTPTLNILDAVG
ncbi:MAG: flagellar protein FlgN [Phycisphaerae bacterium]|nr:flagellar protein FlgN [Phycisphaerae bacterium]